MPLIDDTIKDIYKNVFNLDYNNSILKKDNIIISRNEESIIEFLGLCYRKYSKGFKSIKLFFDFIQESPYFNIEYITNKDILLLNEMYSSKRKFNYKAYFDNHENILSNIKRFFKRFECSS